MFKRTKRMMNAAKKSAECQANHPLAWDLGTELADSTFDSRSDYLKRETRSEEGISRYIRTASETLLESLYDGTLHSESGIEFPEPITDESGACFGIAFMKQLRDRFDDETGGASPRRQCPVCGEKVPLGGGKTVVNAQLMYSIIGVLEVRVKPDESGDAAREFLAEGQELADSLHDYAHRRTTVNPVWQRAGLWTREGKRLAEG